MVLRGLLTGMDSLSHAFQNAVCVLKFAASELVVRGLDRLNGCPSGKETSVVDLEDRMSGFDIS